MTASAKWINACVGIDITRKEMTNILTKMSLRCRESEEDDDTLIAAVPPTRSDILHACDVMEDVAIAYGYDNIKRTVPSIATECFMQPVNKLSDLLRVEL